MPQSKQVWAEGGGRAPSLLSLRLPRSQELRAPQLSAVLGEVALRVLQRPGREAGQGGRGGQVQPWRGRPAAWGAVPPGVLSAGWAGSSQVSPRHPGPWQGSAVKRTHSAAMRTHLASQEDLSSLAVAAGSLSQPQAQPRATSLAPGSSRALGAPPAGPSLSPPQGRAAPRVTRTGLQERPRLLVSWSPVPRDSPRPRGTRLWVRPWLWESYSLSLAFLCTHFAPRLSVVPLPTPPWLTAGPWE